MSIFIVLYHTMFSKDLLTLKFSQNCIAITCILKIQSAVSQVTKRIKIQDAFFQPLAMSQINILN